MFFLIYKGNKIQSLFLYSLLLDIWSGNSKFKVKTRNTMPNTYLIINDRIVQNCIEFYDYLNVFFNHHCYLIRRLKNHSENKKFSNLYCLFVDIWPVKREMLCLEPNNKWQNCTIVQLVLQNCSLPPIDI